MFGVFKPLLYFNFARASLAPLVSRKALMSYRNTHVEILKLGMRPVRMTIRNLVNAALVKSVFLFLWLL